MYEKTCLPIILMTELIFFSRLFNTNEFLSCHLAIFKPELIHDLINDVYDMSDICKYVVLPNEVAGIYN